MLNPLNYSLSQVKQFVVALVVGGISIAAFFVALDPSFEQAAVVVIGEVFAVVGVFAAKEFSYDDMSKTVTSLSGGVITLVGYFATLNPSTVETVAGILSQVLLVGAVLFYNRAPAATPAP